MVILGVDPSIVETGWAIYTKDGIKDAGVIKTKSSDAMEKRLYEIHADIQSLCSSFVPTVLGIETQYIDYGKINNSVLKTVEAKGIIIGSFWGSRSKGRVVDVHPMQVKSYIGMRGRISRKDAKRASLEYVYKNFPHLGKLNHNIADAIIISLVTQSLIKYDYQNAGGFTTKN